MNYVYYKERFYPLSLKKDYIDSGDWPELGVEVSEDTYYTYIHEPPENKKLGTDNNGMPAWVSKQKPTKKENEYNASMEIKARVNAARKFIEYKYWPSQASMGTLDEEGKKRLIAFIEYIKKLESLDPSKILINELPEPPEKYQ